MQLHPRVLPYANCPVIAIDTETTGLDWWDSKFRNGGWVLFEPSVGADYIPVGHETMFDTNEDRAWVAASIHELAQDRNRTFLMHNRGYDENVAATDGVFFKSRIIDTIGLSWSANGNEQSYALKRLGAKYVDPKAAMQEATLKRYMDGNKLKRYTQVPVEVIAPYATQDGRLTWALWERASKAIPAQLQESADLEQKWIGVVSHMAGRGLPINLELAQEIIDGHLAEAHRLRVWLAKEFNYARFNPNSAAQIMSAANRMGIHLDDTTAESLQRSGMRKDLRDGIVKFKQLVHEVTAYAEPIVRIVRGSRDGRLHSSFRTTTRTGRAASGDPINLQGLSKPDNRTADIHRIREVVGYGEDPECPYALASADYAQIDVRVGTHYAERGVGPLTEVLRDPEGDIHTLVMNEIRAMGIDIARTRAKRLVFGSQYGIGQNTFAADVSGLDDNGDWVEVTPKEAKVWLDAHRKRFPAISQCLTQVEMTMKQRGYIYAWDGSMMTLPYGEDPHKAFAWLIQKGGAQLIKRAAVKIAELFEGNSRTHLCLQVHDEVLYDGDRKDIEEASHFVAESMAYAWPAAQIPLYIEPELASPSWAKKKSFGFREPADRKAWETWRMQALRPAPATI